MIEIKDLLLRFENMLFSEEAKKESVVRTVGEVIGVSLNRKDVQIKNNTVYLNIKPIYKNEIMLKREKINALLQDRLGEKSPKDIR